MTSILFLMLALSASAYDYDAVTARIREVYAPVLARKGLTLRVIEEANGLNSARAEIVGKDAIIGVDVTVRSNRSYTEDAFRYMMCHEIGHVMGGAPRRPPPFDWDGDVARDGLMPVSSEGQADYYAALKCFRRLVFAEDHAALERLRPAHPRVTALCASQFGDAASAALCRRTAMAGLEFLRAQAIQVPIDFETPSADVVERPLSSYPPRQCRLDTILAGALCRADMDVEVSGDDPFAGACAPAEDPLGARPACWFAR